MLTFRRYRQEELPWILQRSVETASAQLVARDKPGATAAGVAAQAKRMYDLALATPGTEILVADWPTGLARPGLAAYTLLMPQPNAFTGEGELLVLDIFTDPQLRGRQVGRALLKQAEQVAQSLGCHGGLVAQVAVHNQPSLHMFLKGGFAPERIVLGKRC